MSSRVETSERPLDGYATCGAAECSLRGLHRPVALVEERVAFYIPESGLIDHESVTIRPADDADLACRECGGPCGMADGLPTVYEPLAPRVLA